MKNLQLLVAYLWCTLTLTAGEGMWMPNQLAGFNEKEMKALGMRLNAQDIFRPDSGSLKDAIVHFGSGCTGEVVSNQGLVLTNHHCGFSQIQSLSTISNNYVRDGYWAKTKQDELPCAGLTVTFIIDIIDVTQVMQKELAHLTNENDREAKIKLLSDSLQKAATINTHYKAMVRTFYHGNEFHLFITEVFNDIRLVGAPPESVGNFGGDTDNWMWPRHTGDFSVFRIYANEQNKPAPYSLTNVPYKPRRHLKVNLSGLSEYDFAMVFGFPGRTNQYAPAKAIELIANHTNPNKIMIRDLKLNIWDHWMQANDTIKLKYTSKHVTISNPYKKWKGESLGLKHFNVIEKKKQYEERFKTWAIKNDTAALNSLATLNENYSTITSESNNQDWITETLKGIELTNFASSSEKLINAANADSSQDYINLECDRIISSARSFFKNYDTRVDAKLAPALTNLFLKNTNDSIHPTLIKGKTDLEIQNWYHKYYETSIFSDSVKLIALLQSKNTKKIAAMKDDKMYQLSKEINAIAKQVSALYANRMQTIAQNMRPYMRAIQKFDANKKFYPDANSTLRVSYGKVASAMPKDGVKYLHFTTLDGAVAKADSTNPDFVFPPKLMELYRKKDYGRYEKNGSVPLAMITVNHTTGGNSGSPLLDADGNLVGINFDRMWEGNMSDIYFDDTICRNIAVDIRYVLFIIEKLGDAKHLVDEMTIAKD
ncbi:MAG: hypothetical protein RIQ89_753 [Bacteroidota bacterium]